MCVIWNFLRKVLDVRDMGNVDDQRVILRPVLCLIDFGDRRLALRIGTEPIDSLGWKGHQATIDQVLSSLIESLKGLGGSFGHNKSVGQTRNRSMFVTRFERC